MQDKYIGKLLDNRYEILQVIGTGGMAVVYKALCHRLNRYVAVKILKDEFAKDEEFRNRFRAESHAVAMLSHPNIVSVYDVSRSNSIEYIVMELMDGMTLKQYIDRRGTLSQKESIHFATQILRALSHAHSKGIIHRDIKPHNIMLLRDSTVKVADFGIARLESSQRTITREAFGSVHYIAPEQAKGSDIDCRADIYSTGVVLYEMLTGRLPYEGDTPVSIAIQHINSLPLSPREINPEIPEALEKITMKAMSSNLAKRYASTDEMLMDLEEFRKNPEVKIAYSSPEREDTASVDETKKIPVQELEKEEFKEEKEPENPLKAKIPILAAIVAVVVFLGGLLALILLFSGGDDEENKLAIIPNVIGMTIEEAEAKYTGFDILINENEESRYSDEYAKDQIIKQTPTAHSKNTTGEIYVVLSLGEKTDKIILVDLEKKDKNYAEEYMKENGVAYRIEKETSMDIEEGLVIKTEPAAGEKVYLDEEVVIYVSSGRDEAKKLIIPDVSKSDSKDAEKRLTEAGFMEESIETSKESSADIKEGAVIRTEPAAGEKAYPDEKIKIVISSGAEKIAVPNVAGMDVASAKGKLEGAKITKITIEEVFSGDVEAGKVIKTKPAATKEITPGTGVTVYVSKGPEVEAEKKLVRDFRLPRMEESFVVKITVDDKVQYEGTHASTDEKLTVTLEGKGTATVRMYVNDVVQVETTVVFE